VLEHPLQRRVDRDRERHSHPGLPRAGNACM
jgi:hypothetical protein